MHRVQLILGWASMAIFALLSANAEAGHHHHWHGSYGSYGSYGSSGGSYGTNGGSNGSYGSCGSSGGSYGSYGSCAASVDYSNPDFAPRMPATVQADNQARLTLNVPADAIVYMSNQRMTLDGTSREYIIPGLLAGKKYRYPVRVDVERDGILYSASSEQRIEAGQQLRLVFNQDAGRSEIVAMRD